MTSTGRINPDLLRLINQSYDLCRTCGGRLTTSSPALAGYTKEGAAAYVGPCCEGTLVELATHHYWWWEADKRCSLGTVLWRYMDFAKFVAMVEQRAIHFARADRFDDRFEGAIGIADRKAEWDAYYLAHFREAVRTAPNGPVLDEAEVEQHAQRLLREFSAGGEMERRFSFLSCWHANSGESEALWRFYLPQDQRGVAIRTTADRFIHALGDDPLIKLGRVQYVDYQKRFSGNHDRLFWKRRSLSHEEEVRALILRTDLKTTGIQRPADLTILLDAVVPDPWAADWFVDLVQNTLKRCGLDLPVSRSELRLDPFF